MNSNAEDEFVAVRVQDPRVQQEGSWNSYVDFKIFLHTNSKAFTAKTSCVRRRYSEFAWLKKKLQKNTGLVQVPDLPGKSFFSFSNEDFLESRRKGLQVFLDKVLHMTVCLSDSQLHLFLQTQLPVGHIQDCVQGHTPYSVTDAILTYASSNWGLAQAQEDDANKEPSLTVSYESMESPAPHQPCLQNQDASGPQLQPCADSDPLAGLLEREATAESQRDRKSSVTISQEKECVERDAGPPGATFFLGDGPAGLTRPSDSRTQAPVEVHAPPVGEGAGRHCGADSGEEDGEGTEGDEGGAAARRAGDAVPLSEMRASPDHEGGRWEGNADEATCGSEVSTNSIEILDFKDNDSEEQAAEGHGSPPEALLEVARPEERARETRVASDHGDAAEGPASTINFARGFDSGRPDDPSRDSDVEVAEAGDNADGVRGQENGGDAESDDDSRSLPSSNGSIVKVSDEESACEDSDDSVRAANGHAKAAHGDPDILDLEANGCPVAKEKGEESRRRATPADLNSAVAGVDFLDNGGDLRVPETGEADAERPDESYDPLEEAHEVQVL